MEAQESPPADGTCQALEERFVRALSAVLMGVGVVVLFLRRRHFEPTDPPKPRLRFEGGRVGDPPEILFD